MPTKDDDHIGHVPITPAHDEIASYKRTKAKGSLKSSLGEVPDVASVGGGGGTGGVSTVVLVMVVLVLMATAGLSVYLYKNLQVAEKSIAIYELRISDLEQRLSVTDESMSESSVAMKVKVRELDSEIRKLWDNVWKKAKQQLAEHDAMLQKHQQSIAANETFVSSTKQQFASNTKVVAELRSQLEQARQMRETVLANQARLALQDDKLDNSTDKVNILANDINKLNKRVSSSEEWIESINGFRRQVNRDITELKQRVSTAPSG